MRLMLSAAMAIATITAAASQPAHAWTGDIPAAGAFTCDFSLPATMDMSTVAPLIERDRMYMAQRPGMLRKHVPIRFDPLSLRLQSGGRYLFDTAENAAAYIDWVRNGFVLDGIHFLDRPYFLEPDCHAWTTIGAHDFGDIHDSQIVFRTERWSVPAANQRVLLKSRWPAIREDARVRGYTSVWLLYQKQEQLVSLVYFADRVGPSDPQATDLVGLLALETAPPLGAAFADQGWTKALDRTQLSLTIWFPALPGDQGEPSLWPNSPVLPQPSATDGVCQPSRGEDSTSAPNDCAPRCGDGVWDADENNYSCPSDVPAF